MTCSHGSTPCAHGIVFSRAAGSVSWTFCAQRALAEKSRKEAARFAEWEFAHSVERRMEGVEKYDILV